MISYICEPRPCLVDDKKKGLFWGMFQESYVIPPSPLVGGHSGGVVARPVAMVEMENGHLIYARPEDIKFIDRKFEEYDFRDKEEELNDQN